MDPQLIEIATTRANPGVDPVLHAWGWEIPVYLFLGGIVAGILVITSALELAGRPPGSRSLRLMPLLALVLLSLGMGALFLDLANKEHVYRFYFAFKPSSPMSWGSWILLLIYPAAALQGIGAFSSDERRALRGRLPALKAVLDPILVFSDRARRPLLWVVLLAGAGLGAYTGLLLGTLTARLLWNSAVLAPLFLVSGVSTGAAFMLFFPLEAKERSRLVRWDMIAIGLELFLLGVLVLGHLTAGAAGQLAVSTFLGGGYTAAFWGLVVILGLLVPLAMELVERHRHLAFTVVTPALILLGGLSLRAVLLAAGQETSFRMLIQ